MISTYWFYSVDVCADTLMVSEGSSVARLLIRTCCALCSLQTWTHRILKIFWVFEGLIVVGLCCSSLCLCISRKLFGESEQQNVQ